MTPILASPHICVCWSLSCVWLFATPWTVAHQNLLSMGFSRQEYGMGSHCPLQGIFPTGIKPRFPALQADSLLSEPPGELIISRKALNPFMMTSALHDKQKTFCKISAWLHWTPRSPKSYVDLKKRCITWEWWVKFYLGQNEDWSPGGSISHSSERLLQSGSGGKSKYKVLVKIPWSTQFTKGFLLVMRIWCHHEGI